MLYYLAKFGQKKWVPYLFPAISTSVTLSYFGFQLYGHSTFMRLLNAEDESTHSKQAISENLQSLVRKVYIEAKDHFLVRRNLKLVEITEPVVNWFCSATLDPIQMCSTAFYASKGLLIGLPARYNYNDINELPDHFYQHKEINFFKRPKKSEPDNTNSILVDEKDDNLNEEVKPMTRVIFPRNSELTKAYLNSLILSENAKKYSIAREIFFGDNQRVLIKCVLISVSLLFPVAICRSIIQKLRLEKAHLSKRLNIYAVTGFITSSNYLVFNQLIERFYSVDSDERAMNLGEDYKQGAIEYYTKLLERNKSLRLLVNDLEGVFNEEGEPYRGFVGRIINLSLTERLELAKKYEPKKITRRSSMIL